MTRTRFREFATAYAAEFGASALVALLAYGAAAFAVEFGMPGTASGVVAPQALVTLLAVAAALALSGAARGPRSWSERAWFAMLAVGACAVTYAAAWHYFSSMPATRAWLAPAFALAAAVLFAGAAFPPRHD